MTDQKIKIARVREYLKKHSLDAAVFLTRSNFAWLCNGGDNHVVSQDERGIAALVVSSRSLHLVTNRIEADRVVNEEHVGEFKLHSYPWVKSLAEELQSLLGKGKAIVSDDPVGTGFPALPGDFVNEYRSPLTDQDLKNYRSLGRDTSLVIETVARHLQIGDSGHLVEAELARHLLARGIQPYVLLVAFDDRLKRYRHPTPSSEHLKHYAMLVACGRRHGLIASVTRLVHFGPVDANLLKIHEATCRVEAALWRATVVGETWADAFKAGMKQYKAEGYDKEWELHHQGGSAGFSGRDVFATPTEERKIQLHQAVAWNPSITGAKSEDTFITTDITTGKGHEVITQCSEQWPQIRVTLPDGYTLKRPGILVR